MIKLSGSRFTDIMPENLASQVEVQAIAYAVGRQVEKLCAYLHLSSTYFSTLFKRETGTSFTAYVTTVRMEAAAEAIRGTEEKTYLIAQRCGYEDPNYFSYVFKRHFGVTPTKYRSEGK